MTTRQGSNVIQFSGIPNSLTATPTFTRKGNQIVVVVTEAFATENTPYLFGGEGWRGIGFDRDAVWREDDGVAVGALMDLIAGCVGG